MLLHKAFVQHTRPIYGASERCSIKQALCCCPVQTTHAHTVTLCCPLNVPVTTATVTVFSCCLDNTRVLHCLICKDKDAGTSEKRKGHSVLWKGSGIGVNRLAQWPVIIHETAEEQRPNRLTISPPYLLSCDLHTLVHVSNDWPGSFFHAVIISSGPCLPCARGAVWYGHPLCGFHKCSSGFL